ncbi:MAG: long-chain-fatty-acid--CoA ligase [Pseudonocardia sp.]|nr:long-chain-fatty-acid--CoA ligase [Pseudonocardia sp.]
MDAQLTPLSFLRRSAEVHPHKTAVIHGTRSLTYRELADEAQRLANALRAAGVAPGDRVAYLLPNVPELVVAHFAVPLAGGVLVAMNTRLASEEIRYICDHAEAVVLVVDPAFGDLVTPLLGTLATVRTVVTAVDPDGPPTEGVLPGTVDYRALLDGGEPGGLDWVVDDELAPITINYTSGTTGRPKGVVYTHRGAYLASLGGLALTGYNAASVYLWTLPMFHCNGWCTAWALAAAGGTQVCLREVRGDTIWQLIDAHGITHLNGAPTVVTTIMDAEQARELDRPLVITTAGAPPSPTTIQQMEQMGFTIIHVYGLTETYGPYSVCEAQPAWAALAPEERAHLMSRQGVGMLHTDGVRVVESELRDGALVDVPADGQAMGEIVMRGNGVMKGYFKDPEGTEKAFAGGWFHSGDLGVVYPDNYVELRDRAKDVVVSGGENIATVEVEHAVASHAAVLEVAVIGVPDERWGERPKAFVVLRPGQSVTDTELLAHVRTKIARYKAPREIEFLAELPKTSTGKIQKFDLREKEWAGHTHRIKG